MNAPETRLHVPFRHKGYDGIDLWTWATNYPPAENPAEHIILMSLCTGGYGDHPYLPILHTLNITRRMSGLSDEEIVFHLMNMRKRGLITFDMAELGEYLENRASGFWAIINFEDNPGGE